MTFRQIKLANLAKTMKLTLIQTVALPSVIEVAARRMGTTEEVMIHNAMMNHAVADYFRQLCDVGAAAL